MKFYRIIPIGALLICAASAIEPSEAADNATLVTGFTDAQFLQSLGIIIFGVFVIAIEYHLVYRANSSAEDILRIFTVTLTILSSMFLVVAGYNPQQIAAPLGLFGSIIGYILGSAKKQKANGD